MSEPQIINGAKATSTLNAGRSAPAGADGLRNRDAAVHLSLVGGFELSVHGRVIAMPMGVQRVVAFVALQDGPAARSYVVGNLWPDASEEHARASLRSALWRLRRLKSSVIDAGTSQLRLSADVELDVTEISELATGVTATAPDLDGPAHHAFASELLPGWYDDWVIISRERLRFAQLRALELMAEQWCAAGRLSDAEEAYRTAAALEPFKETIQRGLIQVLIEEGSPGEAIHHYRAYRSLLRDELGAEPSPQMEALLERVTTG